ncbi:MAG: Asp-tRNA(Asn)/Glu-tRNA(Gln) amidotransferase subunit GatC [Planctomycetota bacterium]|nr:MAG: Asp-tRNA(Asn)/Glu-tRNA(Gln) amidotransferase subunit GatC [Planctomycetota bacterium]
MSNTIDADRVRRIAHLARLRLSDDEIALFSEQLGQILTYVEQLDAVDTDGVPPLAHPMPLSNVLRDDTPRPGLSRDAALANAPASRDGFFAVPPVLGGDGGAA